MSDRRRTAREPTARHGRLRRISPAAAVARVIAAAVTIGLVSSVSVSAIALAQLSGNIHTVVLAGDQNEPAVALPPALGKYEGGFNILVVGSDRCEKEGGCKDRQAELNDVTMLVHVAADQQSAVAVSFPRDLVVPIPSCPKEDGSGSYNAMSAQPINNTLSYGGLACTVLTVEALTGMDIPYAGLITFNGVIGMSNAVGGVPVCINGPIRDPYSGLNLPAAGEYTLMGQDALNFLRTRHGVGDGSDLGRISSQQVFLSSLVRTIKSDSTLTDLGKLFGIATAATSNMTLSSKLGNLNTMVAMALVLKDIPLEKITFVQYPGALGQGGVYSGKVAPIKAQADALFRILKDDESFTLAAGTGLGSVVEDTPAPAEPVPAPVPSDGGSPATSASPTPDASLVLTGVKGQTAAEYTCSKANN
ncbi:MAG: LCP family protein [Burkholderiaceae bacterium]|nr:LCP family protein [Microbacteriaceae bacterium]